MYFILLFQTHVVKEIDIDHVNISVLNYKIIFYQVPSSSEDTSMADKEAILATLNIKAMTFDDTFSALARSMLSL